MVSFDLSIILVELPCVSYQFYLLPELKNILINIIDNRSTKQTLIHFIFSMVTHIYQQRYFSEQFFVMSSPGPFITH